MDYKIIGKQALLRYKALKALKIPEEPLTKSYTVNTQQESPEILSLKTKISKLEEEITSLKSRPPKWEPIFSIQIPDSSSIPLISEQSSYELISELTKELLALSIPKML
ncbi:hypothetical protein SteCoe_33290 [Stentor coeruleus]|uniref:Uncharacterized protein n=1 Tax=Stentor coeruleus TaxID=5963 RepID=A0A1R2AX30_9CILI|nr:hypothetical protein SteCoe_33290 [Stentor coeruleus]